MVITTTILHNSSINHSLHLLSSPGHLLRVASLSVNFTLAFALASASSSSSSPRDGRSIVSVLDVAPFSTSASSLSVALSHTAQRTHTAPVVGHTYTSHS